MREIPTVPLALGVAGLIPFWALAVALLTRGAFGLPASDIDRALATYAALIVSFLGGIRWGLASARAPQDAITFAFSILPSLLAWAFLVLPEPWRLVALGTLAFALGPMDARMAEDGLSPRWLARLRLILSTGASAALLIGALAAR